MFKAKNVKGIPTIIKACTRCEAPFLSMYYNLEENKLYTEEGENRYLVTKLNTRTVQDKDSIISALDRWLNS